MVCLTCLEFYADFQHHFGHFSVVGPPNHQFLGYLTQYLPNFSISDQLLIPNDFSSERQMIISLYVQDL